MTGSSDWTALRWAAPALTAPYENISDVSAWDGGYVAVGTLQNAKGGLQAAAWRSSDWRTWTRTMLDVPASGNSALGTILPVGSELVAIGTSGESKCVPPEGEGQVCGPAPVAVWTSTDGQRWQRVATSGSLAGVAIDGAASNGTQLVLAGNTGWGKPGIWTSSDGARWVLATLPPATFTNAHFGGLVALTSGFIATGSTGGAKPVCCAGGGSQTTPAAWYSSDGKTWQSASIDGAAGHVGDQIGPVFAGGAGLIAWSARDEPYDWVSPDGRHWSTLRRTIAYPVIPRASDGSRIIGDSYTTTGRAAFWTSADGRSWRPLGVRGATDQVPFWDPSGGPTADTFFVFPNGVGLVGQNGTNRFPAWFAAAEPGS